MYATNMCACPRSIVLNALAPHRLTTLPLLLPPPIPLLTEGDEGEGSPARAAGGLKVSRSAALWSVQIPVV